MKKVWRWILLTNLHLDLSKSVNPQTRKYFNLICGRGFKLFKPLNPVELENPSTLYEDILHSHIHQSLSRVPFTTKYEYGNMLGVKYNKHSSLDKMCLTVKEGSFVTVLSIQDSLDLVLQYLCDCDAKVIRALPNYHQLSRILLNVELDYLDIVGEFSQLINVDDKLDMYMSNLLSTSSDTNEFVTKFFTNLVKTTEDLLLKCNTSLLEVLHFDSLFPISKDLTSIVYKTSELVNVRAFLDGWYALNIKSYRPMEYLSSINEVLI